MGGCSSSPVTALRLAEGDVIWSGLPELPESEPTGVFYLCKNGLFMRENMMFRMCGIAVRTRSGCLRVLVPISSKLSNVRLIDVQQLYCPERSKVMVTRVCQDLSEKEGALLADWAERLAHEPNLADRVTVLMPYGEKMFVSRLVAEAFVAVGRAAAVGRVYAACAKRPHSLNFKKLRTVYMGQAAILSEATSAESSMIGGPHGCEESVEVAPSCEQGSSCTATCTGTGTVIGTCTGTCTGAGTSTCTGTGTGAESQGSSQLEDTVMYGGGGRGVPVPAGALAASRNAREHAKEHQTQHSLLSTCPEGGPDGAELTSISTAPVDALNATSHSKHRSEEALGDARDGGTKKEPWTRSKPSFAMSSCPEATTSDRSHHSVVMNAALNSLATQPLGVGEAPSNRDWVPSATKSWSYLWGSTQSNINPGKSTKSLPPASAPQWPSFCGRSTSARHTDGVATPAAATTEKGTGECPRWVSMGNQDGGFCSLGGSLGGILNFSGWYDQSAPQILCPEALEGAGMADEEELNNAKNLDMMA